MSITGFGVDAMPLTKDIHTDCGQAFRGEHPASQADFRAVCQLLWEAYQLISNDSGHAVDQRDWQREAVKVLFDGN